MKKKNVVVYFIIGIFAVIAIGLGMNRIIPKNIHSFLKGQDAYVMQCSVSKVGKVGVPPIELTHENLQRLMEILEETDFYYDGRYGNEMIGNLYNVQFGVENDGWWTGAFSMFISDENIVYIGEKQYRIKSEKDVITFLESLF